MIPVEVCHFTKKSTALEHILPEKRLKLGQIKFTNDPKESMIRTGGYTRKENEVLAPNIEGECFAESLRVHDEEWKVMCFTASRAKPGDTSPLKFRRDMIETIQGWNESELPGYNHPRMWDQYAERHEGFCLVFDGVKLDQTLHKELGEGSKIFSGMVTYVDIKSGSGSLLGLDYSDVIKIGPTEAARKHFCKYYEHYFLKKNLDWESETEFRWLVHSIENKPEYVSIAWGLKAVIIGMNFPRADYEIVKSLCKELAIPAGKMGWASGLPSVDYDFSP